MTWPVNKLHRYLNHQQLDRELEKVAEDIKSRAGGPENWHDILFYYVAEHVHGWSKRNQSPGWKQTESCNDFFTAEDACSPDFMADRKNDEEMKLVQELIERVEKLEDQVAKWKEFESEVGQVLDEFQKSKKDKMISSSK